MLLAVASCDVDAQVCGILGREDVINLLKMNSAKNKKIQKSGSGPQKCASSLCTMNIPCSDRNFCLLSVRWIEEEAQETITRKIWRALEKNIVLHICGTKLGICVCQIQSNCWISDFSISQNNDLLKKFPIVSETTQLRWPTMSFGISTRGGV